MMILKMIRSNVLSVNVQEEVTYHMKAADFQWI